MYIIIDCLFKIIMYVKYCPKFVPLEGGNYPLSSSKLYNTCILSLSLSLSLTPTLSLSPLHSLSPPPPLHLSRYPAALVVPEKVTDDSLAAVASQFQHQRLPVVTWKHPDKKVVLLRSSSFVPCSIAKKTVSSSTLAGIRHPSVAKQAKAAATNAVSGK